MQRYTELLYWLKYRDKIHYDDKLEDVVFDEGVPQRAIDSFYAWWEHNHE